MPAIPRRGRAPGYWAPRAYCVLSQSGVIPGIVELLKDKLYLNGRRAALWLPVRSTDPGVVQCTCYKPAAQRSDTRCLTCVSGASRVFVRGRGLVRVDALVDSTFEVWSGKAWRKARAWQTGVRETHTLEASPGLSLRLTDDHLVKHDDGEWSQMADLEIGDRLDFAPPMDAFPRKAVTVPVVTEPQTGPLQNSYRFPRVDSFDVGLMMGYIVGDGSVTKRKYPMVQIAMAEKDGDDIEHLNDLVCAWTGSATSTFVRTIQRSSGVVPCAAPAPMRTAHWRVKGLSEFLQKLGVDKQSAPDARRAPSHVFTASRDCVRGFISGLVSTDGCIGVAGKRISISIASVSRGLLQDVQLLLMGFGIKSSICEYKARAKKMPSYRRLFKLEIAARDHVVRFRDEVGIFNKRKAAKLNAALLEGETTRRRDRRGDKVIAKARPPRVVAKTPTGICEPVYDLSVEGDHQFVADGITVHNCYGTQYAPGYLKFLHETIWFASAQYATLTLTNTVINTTIKPYRIVLATGALTGTIVTPDATWTNPQNADWTFDLAAFREMSTDDFNVEFSKDAGVTWFDIADINGPPKPIGATGTIRFRVTLSRISATTQSPEFEILRLRRPLPEFVPTEMQQQRPDLPAGEILILRTWEQEQVLRNIVAGRQVNLESDGGWTTPLNTFDTRIVADTPPARIDDRQAGPHPFYEQREGIHTGQRDVMTQIRFNENLRVFTHQSFATRKAQQGSNAGTIAGEIYNLVF